MTEHDMPLNGLVYNGTPIAENGDRLNLTDMWRAAGSPSGRAPNDWLNSADAKRFVEFLVETLNAGNSGNGENQGLTRTVRGGNNPRTEAHWQIGLAYAKYLSPEFHMWCNTVVRERMEGKLVRPAGVTPDVVGGIMKGVVNKRIEPLETAVVETARQVQELARRVNDLMLIADSHGAVARDLVSVRQLLDDAGALPKGRNSVNRKIGNALRDIALKNEVRGCRKDLHSNVWLFPIDFAHEFMESVGNGWVRSHNAALAGQGELVFDDRRKTPRRKKTAGNDDLSFGRIGEIIESRAQAIAKEHHGMDGEALASALRLQQARMRKELRGITDQDAETFVRQVIARVLELLKAA